MNCPNGTVDLRTGELRTHNPTDLLTKVTHAKYNPHAKAPKFEAFLKRVLPSAELRRFVQRLTGYALTGDTSEQILPFFYGTGANGKSTFLNIVLKAVGDYGLQAGQSLLLAKKSESHPTELADLFRARFVVSSELEDGRRFAEALIKQLTGGDRVRARRMREDLWEFDPTHTVIVAANHKPEVRGTDKGIWRRIKIVPWEVSIPDAERDPKLPEKLETELEGILAWCVQGAIEWQRDGLAEPREVTAETDEYQRDQDVLASFIYDECVEAPDLYVKSETLYVRYKDWCDLNGEYQQSQKAFSQRLKERGYPKVRRKYGMVWEGIALRDSGNDGPGAGLDPTPGVGLSADPTPPESGIGKPKTDRENEGCRVVYPKSALPPESPTRNSVSTGKNHTPPYTLHPSYIDSNEQLRDALEGFGGSR